MSSRERRGLQDGNDRVATIARWLSQPPQSDRVVELVLLSKAGDDEFSVVARYKRENVTRDLAVELSNLCQDQADDVGGQISARLEWRTEDGQAYASKALRARVQRADGSLPLEAWDSSSASIIAQTQRHNEILLRHVVDTTRLVADSIDRSNERVERLFGYVDRVLEKLSARADAAESDLAQLAAERDQAVAVAEEAVAQADEAVATAEANMANDKLAKVIEIGQQALLGGAK